MPGTHARVDGLTGHTRVKADPKRPCHGTQLTEHKGVEADSQRPDVCSSSAVGAAIAHLWGEEGWSANCTNHHIVRPALLRAAKVADAHPAVCPQQEVVWLDVPVRHSHGMHVVNALHACPIPCQGSSQQRLSCFCISMALTCILTPYRTLSRAGSSMA